MSRNLKKLLISSALLIVAAMVLWLSFLGYMVQLCKKEVGLIEKNLRAKGYDLTYKGLDSSSLFSSITLHMHQVHFKNSDDRIAWRGEDVWLSVRPWDIHTVNITLSGDHTIAVAIEEMAVRGTARLVEGRGRVKLTPQHTLEEATLSVTQVFFADANLKPIPVHLQGLSFQGANLSSPLESHFSLRASLEGLSPSLTGWDIPDAPLILSFDGALSGFLPTHPFPHSLAEWRNGGGVLDVKLARLAWPTMALEGEGTFTFDKDMYPLAAFSVQIMNFQKMLNNMVLFEWVKKKDAPLIAFMATMMGKPNEATGEITIKAPLTLQKRTVFLGGLPFPLYKFK